MLTLTFAALAVLLTAWVAYPAVLAAFARRVDPLPPLPAELPRVSLIVATREAPELIADRVAHLVEENDYPRDRLRVVVAVDHRAAHAPEAYARLLGDSARVVRGDAPGGKATALNAGVRAAETELLILADSQQRFNREAISLLVRAMQDRSFGAVSGAVAQKSGDGLMDMYWRYERRIREGQAAVHSVVSSTGQICAVRRELWPTLPAELICDDLYMTLHVVLAGHRVGYCPAAIATDSRAFTREQHFQRKVRTLTGLVQVCAWSPQVMLPWRNPIWIHFFCHKLVRLITPYLAAIVAIGFAITALKLGGAPVWYALGAAIGLGALVALVRPAMVKRRAEQVRWAMYLQSVPLIATWNGLRGRWQVWQPHQVHSHAAPLADVASVEVRS